MTTRSIWLRLLFTALATAAPEVGCQPVSAAPDAPEVAVCHPVSREVVDYDDFTGRIEAAQSVDIKARVSGYLTAIYFKEGSAVKRGDLLFEIDPRPYRAELDKADANLVLSQAQLKLAMTQVERVKALLQKGSASREELDKADAERITADAAVLATRAARDRAQLNLNYTKITSPIDGRIGRAILSVGNLVKADTTLLTTLVSVDPVYVFFDMDERTVLRRAKQHRDGKAPSDEVAMALIDETNWPRTGKFMPADARIDPKTGTMRCRAVFPNPGGLMMPGMFARVRMAAGEPYKASAIPESAIQYKFFAPGSGDPFLVVIDERDRVVERGVELGPTHNAFHIVKNGLAMTDRVVVKPKGLKDGQKVKPKLVEMPASPRGEPVLPAPKQP
jgi:RND family efflux transporter MFP subunit